MSEWWSYGLADFLLFSPRTYYRLIQRYNESLWPAHIPALLASTGIIASLRWPSPRTGRGVSAVVAVLVAWTAWGFVVRRYATINWAAEYFAAALVLTAVIFLAYAIGGMLVYRPAGGARGKAGLAMLGLGGLVYPLFAPLSGRPWTQAEIFGLAPEPTALAALGLLLLADPPARWWVLLPPALWCLVAGATARAMGAAEAVVLIPAALVALPVAWLRGRRSP